MTDREAHEATALELEPRPDVSVEDALRVELVVARIQHAQADVARAQAVLRAAIAEKDAFLAKLRERYNLRPGDVVDFSARTIGREHPNPNGDFGIAKGEGAV